MGKSVFKMKQNDTSPELQVTLKDTSNNVVDLTGSTVVFSMSIAGIVKVNRQSATLVTAASGIVKYTWQSGDTDTVGTFVGEFEVTYPGSLVETFPNSVTDRIEIIIAKEIA